MTDKRMADHFNQVFCNIGPEFARDIPNPSENYVKNVFNNTVNWTHIAEIKG